jgi:hypothetical protein
LESPSTISRGRLFSSSFLFVELTLGRVGQALSSATPRYSVDNCEKSLDKLYIWIVLKTNYKNLWLKKRTVVLGYDANEYVVAQAIECRRKPQFGGRANMMWRKSLMILMVFVSGMILLTQSTWATEAELLETMLADESVTARTWTDAHGIPSVGPAVPCDVDCLTGSWAVQLRNVDELGEECWAGCIVEIGPGGIIEKGKYYDCNGKKSPIIGGYLTMSSGCTVKGKIETPKGTLYATPGGLIIGNKLVLQLTTLDPVNQCERDEIEGLLNYHREDIRGVLLRIERERQERQLEQLEF